MTTIVVTLLSGRTITHSTEGTMLPMPIGDVLKLVDAEGVTFLYNWRLIARLEVKDIALMNQEAQQRRA